jgi:hypothetical protein
MTAPRSNTDILNNFVKLKLEGGLIGNDSEGVNKTRLTVRLGTEATIRAPEIEVSSGDLFVFDKTAITDQDIDNSPVESTDYLLTYDASEDELKRILISSIDHDQLTNFVAAEHVDWTNTSTNLDTSGTIECDATLRIKGTSATAGTLELYEDTDNGSNKVSLKPPASLSADYTLTLPTDDGTSNQVLATDGSGSLSWQNYVPFNNLTTDNAPDGEADYLMFYDASASTYDKMLVKNTTKFAAFAFTRDATTASGSQRPCLP